MDKVTSYYIVPANFATSSMPMNVRGHHSSIHKAVNAHRQMVEERSNRQAFRQLEASAPNVQFTGENMQVAGASGQEASTSNDMNFMDNEMIDSASGPAKLAMIQAFQNSEPERPMMGEPVPKGSYLDVEA